MCVRQLKHIYIYIQNWPPPNVQDMVTALNLINNNNHLLLIIIIHFIGMKKFNVIEKIFHFKSIFKNLLMCILHKF